MPLNSGEEFAGYRIVRLLGVGRLGEVYLAQHPRSPRQNALRVLPTALSADADFRQRFARDADLAAGLRHPHIVAVFDHGEYDGRLWITSEYVDGTDAATLLRLDYSDGLRSQEAVEIVTAVADALDYAHQRGLLHRDVRPANILLSDPGRSAPRILLTDLGIACDRDDLSGQPHTNVEAVRYASPEQLTGAPIDGRADQYALAVTAYELFSGSVPFDDPDPAVVVGHHLNAPVMGLAGKRLDLVGMDRALAVALAKSPAQRYTTCTGLGDALAGAEAKRAQDEELSRQQRVLTVPDPIQQPPPATPWPPPMVPAPAATASSPRSARWPLVLSALAAVLVFAVGAYVLWPSGEDEDATAASRSTGTSTAMSSESPTAGSTVAPTATTSAVPIAINPVGPTAISSGTFVYQPLWPFATQQDADRWLREDAAQGVAPWHADPVATALGFTRDYLGFTEMTHAALLSQQADEAFVEVGHLGGDRPLIAAVVHLVRFGPSPNAPWEVVGTEDDPLTLEQPKYGSPVGATFVAGGRITGVDEAIHVEAHVLGAPTLVGESCCQMAGGEDSPWSAPVAISGVPSGALVTLVARTGGHFAEVERFAVSGVRFV